MMSWGCLPVTIVGEAPSKSSDPKRPFADCWSGRWLAKMAGFETFEDLSKNANFRNVLRRWPGYGYAGEKGSAFPMDLAVRYAKSLDLDGTLLLAGRRVAKAVDLAFWGREKKRVRLDRMDYFEWTRTERHCLPCRIAVIPHPSGCNRWWNYESNRLLAQEFLRKAIAR
jgi:hypothetical protein